MKKKNQFSHFWGDLFPFGVLLLIHRLWPPPLPLLSCSLSSFFGFLRIYQTRFYQLSYSAIILIAKIGTDICWLFSLCSFWLWTCYGCQGLHDQPSYKDLCQGSSFYGWLLLYELALACCFCLQKSTQGACLQGDCRGFFWSGLAIFWILVFYSFFSL